LSAAVCGMEKKWMHPKGKSSKFRKENLFY
jgi:hypothetical protein